MRLIDAKEVERQIKNGMAKSPVVMGMMLRWIRKQPTIDAVPVRHGRWISNDPYVGWHCLSCERSNNYAFRWDCEESKYVLQDHYCPNCGAKMDEVSE